MDEKSASSQLSKFFSLTKILFVFVFVALALLAWVFYSRYQK